MIYSAIFACSIPLSAAATFDGIRQGSGEDTTIVEDTVIVNGSILNYGGTNKTLDITATDQGIYDEEVGGYVSVSVELKPTEKNHGIYVDGATNKTIISVQHPGSWIKVKGTDVSGYSAVSAFNRGSITLNGNVYSSSGGITANSASKININGDVVLERGSLSYSGITVTGNVEIRNGGLQDAVAVQGDRIIVHKGPNTETGRFAAAIANGGMQVSRYTAEFTVTGDVMTDCGLIELTMLRNSTLVGKTFMQDMEPSYNVPVINFTMKDASQWTVTGDSLMSNLIMESGTSLIFCFDEGEADFTNINALAVSLASGTILNLDQDASYFGSGMTVDLFTVSESFIDEGTMIVSRDGYILEIDPAQSGDGSYHLTGQVLGAIPEPTGSVLVLAGLSVVFMRRRA